MRYVLALLGLLVTPALAQVPVYPPVDTSVLQTAVDNAQSTANAAKTSADASVKTVNSISPITGNVTVPVAQFVSGFTAGSPGLVASLMTNAPCNASRVGFYAVVSDLYNGATATNEVMRCGQTGVLFYWRPQRTDFSVVNTTTSGTTTLTPLLTAPTVVFTGSLLGNITITPSVTNAWPGASFTVINRGVLGLFGINLTGVTGGTLALLAGGQRTIFYTCDSSAVCAWQGY